MEKILLPYAATGYFSKAVTDYLNESGALAAFYDYPPKLSSIPEIIKKRAGYSTNRDVLCKALLDQHQKFRGDNLFKEVFQNIESLKGRATFTVTTAHQPNLFLGPLYLIYKIVSAVNLSKKLNQEFSDYHFVPVYWLGSEDHDKEELNHINLFGKTFTWDTDQQGAFGRMKTESLLPLIEEIKNILGNSEGTERCIELLKDCYLGEKTIAAATTKILYKFFSADGLVIVDGDDPGLKKLFIPVIEKEVFQQFSFPVVKKSTELFSEKYTSQITPREINLFYLDENIRQRIVKENNRWQVLNTSLSFSETEMGDLIKTESWKFSPNVVLRPLYQCMILPDVSFVGGGSEVSYWLQLKSLFDSEGVPFPMVVLRNSVLWIDSNLAARMDKLNIPVEEIFMSPEGLIKKHLQKQAGELISLEDEKQKLEELMKYVLQRAMQLDASLKGTVEAEKIKMQKSLEAIEEKLRKAAKKKEEVSVQQIQTIKEKLFPANTLQERYDNFLSIYLRKNHDFFSALKTALDPMELQFTVLIDRE